MTKIEKFWSDRLEKSNTKKELDEFVFYVSIDKRLSRDVTRMFIRKALVKQGNI